MSNLPPFRLRELKNRAAFLHKDLHRQSATSRQSAHRFLSLPRYTDKTSDWILKHTDEIKLKDAFAVIALEYGFKNWSGLNHYIVEKDCLYNSRGILYIHAWFQDYDQARDYREKYGGYLLTFWNDFIICGNEYLKCIGLHQFQHQWSCIGYDWVFPQDLRTWNFLCEKAKKNYLKRK